MTRRRVVQWLLVALAYFAAARLGLAMQLGATQASPVWPPSGIAVAAIVLLGPGVWPGVLVGASLANLLESGGGPAAALVNSGIGIGNCLEGLAGAALVRRFAGGGARSRPSAGYGPSREPGSCRRSWRARRRRCWR